MNDHSITVWKEKQKMALEKTWNQDYANDMFILWYLHDIGKQFGYTADHAERWWEILRRSDYKYWQEVYYHGETDIQYHSLYLDILNMADMQIDKYGNDVGYDKRLEDIATRYGKNSKQYVNAVKLVKILKENNKWIDYY